MTGRQVAQRAPGDASVNVPMSSVTRPRAPVPTVPSGASGARSRARAAAVLNASASSCAGGSRWRARRCVAADRRPRCARARRLRPGAARHRRRRGRPRRRARVHAPVDRPAAGRRCARRGARPAVPRLSARVRGGDQPAERDPRRLELGRLRHRHPAVARQGGGARAARHAGRVAPLADRARRPQPRAGAGVPDAAGAAPVGGYDGVRLLGYARGPSSRSSATTSWSARRASVRAAIDAAHRPSAVARG